MRRAGALCGVVVLAIALTTTTAHAGVPHGFYGLNSWTSGLSAGEYQTMDRHDVGVLRFQFNWQAAEPGPGAFDWNRSDAYIGQSLQAGMKPLPFFFATPNWLSKKYARPPIHSRRARRAWKQFLTKAVDRYGKGGTFQTQNPTVPDKWVRVWQIWNEPNLRNYWKPEPNAKEYAKLLRISAKAIYRADPGARVMVAGMFYGGKKGTIPSWRVLKTIYKQHGRRTFDIASVHPYSPGLSYMRYQIMKMRKTLKRHHDRKVPLWVTELGWGSARNSSPLTKGRKGQARMLRRSFGYITHRRRHLGVDKLLWFSWRDGAISVTGNCQFCSSNGLFTEDLDPKPAWREYKRFAHRAG